MAAMNKPSGPSRAQVAADRIATLSGEQQKLKAAAAERRAASAEEEGHAPSFTARSTRSTPTDRPSRYLR
jgi:hypothetical protein